MRCAENCCNFVHFSLDNHRFVGYTESMDDPQIMELTSQWLKGKGESETVILKILTLPNPCVVASKITCKLCRLSFEDADRFIRQLAVTVAES